MILDKMKEAQQSGIVGRELTQATWKRKDAGHCAWISSPSEMDVPEPLHQHEGIEDIRLISCIKINLRNWTAHRKARLLDGMGNVRGVADVRNRTLSDEELAKWHRHDGSIDQNWWHEAAGSTEKLS